MTSVLWEKQSIIALQNCKYSKPICIDPIIIHAVTVTGVASANDTATVVNDNYTNHGFEASAWSVCSLSQPSTSIVQ